MNDDLAQLIEEAVELTGTTSPPQFEDDSPVLRDAGVEGEDGFYLVGLIGGKDVGKSALVNALVGQAISEQTSYGPGTEIVVAYVHEECRDGLIALLELETPGRYRVVTHSIDALRRQVLLDLPDVDSHWANHVEITRRMLRHILFPIWVQSVEKYADGQAQSLLAKVAAGNDPSNFIFCLNKVDQLPPGDAKELRDDYANRVARTLSLSQVPSVCMISAIRPDQFDLPTLREKLARQKSDGAIARSKDLAVRQQDRSLLAWFDGQRLPENLERVRRLEDEAQELAADRLGVPLLERTVPGILNDPGNRMALVDAAMHLRVSRWPIVGIIHTLLNPMFALVRRNVGAAATGGAQPPADALVGAYLSPSGVPLSLDIQATFARLQQSHPSVAPLYRQRKLWDAMPADLAAADLRRRLSATVERQRQTIESWLDRRTWATAPWRWLLTIGAVLWFPIVQPVLEIFLQDNLPKTAQRVALLIVQLLGVTYLLKSVGFLCIYFLVLWLALRWDTNRRVGRFIAQWKSAATSAEPSLNLTRASLDWIDELIEPIRGHRQRLESLIARVELLREQSRRPIAPPVAA